METETPERPTSSSTIANEPFVVPEYSNADNSRVTPVTADFIDAGNTEFRVHGVRVHAVQPDSVIQIINQWQTSTPKFRYLVSTNINNIVSALDDTLYRDVMECADLSVPDGIPIIWRGRRSGFDLPQRCGIEEVMLALFELSNQENDPRYTHFFFGNTQQVLDELKASLLKTYPNLKIVGMLSPPFRTATPEEDSEHVRLINEVAPDFLWVSLGCPKQEIWLYEHRHLINEGLGGGAGAVFNFLSGEKPKAPKWLQNFGMEWLMRLVLDPKRLWRRYLLKYPRFYLRYTQSWFGQRRTT